MANNESLKLAAVKVKANKYSSEYIDFQLKQILKEKESVDKSHRISLLPKLVNKLNDEKLDQLLALKNSNVARLAAKLKALQKGPKHTTLLRLQQTRSRLDL